MKRITVNLLAAVVVVIGITAVTSSQEGPSRRDLYKFVWDFVIIGDGEVTTEDLKNIAFYYSSMPGETVSKINEVFRSPGLSNRQKTKSICNLLKGLRYGNVITKSGETYRGVVCFQAYNAPRDQLHVEFTKGGVTDIPVREIVEISHRDKQYILKTNQNNSFDTTFVGYKGQYNYRYYVRVYTDGRGPIDVSNEQIKRIVLGNLKHIQCPQCFRVMEIDWKYCPYDGTRLLDGAKWNANAHK